MGESAPGVAGTYTCNVTNDLGSDSMDVVAVGEFWLLILCYSDHPACKSNLLKTYKDREEVRLRLHKSGCYYRVINLDMFHCNLHAEQAN